MSTKAGKKRAKKKVPDFSAMFDLDPDEGLAFKDVVSAAFHLQDRLGQMGLVTFPMVTGGKGVHVIAPLTPSAEWPQVKDLPITGRSRPVYRCARQGEADGQDLRRLSAHQRGASAVMPYNAWSRPLAPIAVPLSWEELRTLDGPDQWHIGYAGEMVKRSASKYPAHWGRADQILPDL